jgi:hypothetical protein
VLDEIWSFGLRNSFRFSFDRSTGDLFRGDVGKTGARRPTSSRRVPAAPTSAGVMEARCARTRGELSC